MELPKKITDDIWEYCRLNSITDITAFTIKMVQQGFTVEKYGATPSERVVEKIVEKIVEVEVIKEVEKIVEVEKEVIKEIRITDNEETNKLLLELEKVKSEVNEQLKHNLDINNLKNKLETENGDLNKLITKLEGELATEKNKPKVETKKDIYGEGKIGYFGSNTDDIWNKDK